MSEKQLEAERAYAIALCRRGNLALRDAAGLAPEAGDAELVMNELAVRDAAEELRAAWRDGTLS